MQPDLDLTDAARLDRAMLRAGVGTGWLAEALDIQPATVRRWRLGALAVVPGVVEWIEGLADAREAYLAARPLPEGWVVNAPRV